MEYAFAKEETHKNRQLLLPPLPHQVSPEQPKIFHEAHGINDV
jgi:hypothetical protein